MAEKNMATEPGNKCDQASQLCRVFAENHFTCSETVTDPNAVMAEFSSSYHTADKNLVILSSEQNDTTTGLNIIVGQGEEHLGYMVVVDPDRVDTTGYAYTAEHVTVIDPNVSSGYIQNHNPQGEIVLRSEAYAVNGSQLTVNNVDCLQSELPVALTLASLTKEATVQKVLQEVSGNQSSETNGGMIHNDGTVLLSSLNICRDSNIEQTARAGVTNKETTSSLPPFSDLKSSHATGLMHTFKRESVESGNSPRNMSTIGNQCQGTQEFKSRLETNTSQVETNRCRKDKLVPTTGRRLLELSCLIEALEPLLSCKCGMSKLQLKEDISKADFLYSALYLVCEFCERSLYLPTSKSSDTGHGVPQWEVNYCTEVLRNEHKVEDNFLELLFSVYNVPYVKCCEKIELEDNNNGNSNFVEDDGHMETSHHLDEAIQSTDDYFTTPCHVGSSEKESLATVDNIPDVNENTGTNFTSEKKVKRVQKVHQCPLCSQKFSSKQILASHTKEHVGTVFSCVKCSGNFHTEAALRKHMRVHKLECSVCGKSFRKGFNLATHLRTHSGERPHKCTLCDKSFTDSSTLRKHRVSIHSTERRLQCDVCGKTFYHYGHLREHVRRHTGERPYTCNVCGKSFPYHDSIKKHMVVHTDQHKFKCSICPRTFRWRESLKQHSKTHGLCDASGGKKGPGEFNTDVQKNDGERRQVEHSFERAGTENMLESSVNEKNENRLGAEVQYNPQYYVQ